MKSRGSSTLVLAALMLATSAPESAADPKVPIGLDPGGTAIGIVTTGVDYTDPEIAARLARDGEGEAIAMDLVDGDVRPFAAAGDGNGTRLAKAMLSVYRHSRLIVARADTADGGSVARALMFLSQTPAVVVALDVPAGQPAIGVLLAAAGTKLKRPLIVAPADALTPGAQPGPSLLAVAPAPSGPPDGAVAPAIEAWVTARGSSMFTGLGKPPPDRLEAAALLAGHAACAVHGKAVTAAAEIKAAVLALARPASEGPGIPVHDPMCWYGGVRN